MSALFSEEVAIDSSNVKNPSTAWKLAFIPSAGQIYNKDYHKALGFWLLELYSISKFDSYNKQNKLGNRNTYAWWIMGLYMMSILDAYVDAHLSTFPQPSKSKDLDINK
tara:strand:- start:78 stop:404 length:327 start_codon:yes stop_codon:yes gene_type:complete